MTFPFEQLYISLFPHASQDRLDNYTHIRLLQPVSATNPNQVDLCRPISGPSTRRKHCELCILKSIPVPRGDPDTQGRLLKELAIHRAVSLGSDPFLDRILSLVSHFITPSFYHRKTQKTATDDVEAYIIMVLPYCPKGSLADFVAERLARNSYVFGKGEVLKESELRWVIMELVKALARCHERGVVHGNVKADNIMLWQNSCETVGTSKGNTQLLLTDFSSSKWTDEIADSTLDGVLYSSERGIEVDIEALGHLCIFLLTGTMSAVQSDETRSSSSLSDVRVEENNPSSQLNLQNVSQDCRDLIKGMLLEDDKRRLNLTNILSHPFMMSDLLVTPLDGTAKRYGNTLHKSVKTPLGNRNRDSYEKAGSSSATLLSVMQRVSPAVFSTAESRVEKRKTPFGVVRLAKEKVAGVAMASKATSWGNGYGTRGLVSVKQRLKGGKIQITRDGMVIIGMKDVSLAISASGVPLTKYLLESEDQTKIEGLYEIAARWLQFHRQKSTIAGFMLSCDDYQNGQVRESVRKSDGAVDYIGYCSVKANGPLPDYEIRFAAVEEARKRQDEWNVQVQVQVQRNQSRLRLFTQLQGVGKRTDSCWKETMVAIKSSKKGEESQWTMSGNSKTSLVVKDLSQREARAIERSIQACQSVDNIFQALVGQKL